MKKWLKKLSAQNIANGFFILFLATFTFPVRHLIYDKSSYATGLFSEFTSVFFEINEIFLALAFLSLGIAIIQNHKLGEFKKELSKLNPKLIMLVLTFFLSVEIAVFFAMDKKLAFLGTLKLLEMLGVVIFILISKINIKRIIGILMIVALIQGLIGTIQFIIKGNIGLGFPGEQPLNLLQAGSPKIRVNNEFYIRATGTFLHPNILAGFLVIAFMLAENLNKYWKNIRWILIIPLLLTFSKAGLLAFVICALPAKKITTPIAVLSVSLLYFLTQLKDFINSRIMIDASFLERWELLKNSAELFLHYPLGTGAKNFILSLPCINPGLAPWQLQPVHNIFLLIGNELGVFAMATFMILVISLFIKFKTSRNLLLTIIILGLVDHYLITIHAGMIILALAIGITLAQGEKKLTRKLVDFSQKLQKRNHS